MSDKKHTVSESADKITLKTKLVRGEGTRDQDKIDVKVKSNDPQEAATKLHNTILAIKGENTPAELRNTQPGEDE